VSQVKAEVENARGMYLYRFSLSLFILSFSDVSEFTSHVNHQLQKFALQHENESRKSRKLRRKNCALSNSFLMVGLSNYRSTPQVNVERVEQKLDGVVSLIESIHEVVSNQRKLASALDDRTASTTASHPPRFINQSESQIPHGLHDQISQNTDPSTSGIYPVSDAPAGQSSLSESQHSGSILSNAYMPNFAEANALLDIFKGQMSPNFPFIAIPQSMSAEELYHDKPFFFISILAIASRDSVQQKGLGKLLIKQFAERMFVNCERNLDLLLGILTYAGWLVLT
jgi:hypothetical protein